MSQKQNGRDGNAALCSLLLPSLLTCQIAEGCGASRAAYPGVGCGALPGTRGRAVVGMGTVVSPWQGGVRRLCLSPACRSSCGGSTRA